MYENYEEFEACKLQCRDCEVGAVYDKVVASDGCKEKPIVMIVGECPGRDEVEQGKPFVGKAGKLLRATLNEFGFRKTKAIISNVIPCRPENNKFPQDSSLVKACYKQWLMEEIKLLRPKFLLLLGAQSLKYLLGMQGITKLRGSWYPLILQADHYCECMPTFHPSYVQRKEHMKEGKEIKEAFLRDIKEVAKRAGFHKPKPSKQIGWEMV
jgi:DNA polymerase